MTFKLDTDSTIGHTLRGQMLRLRKKVFCDTLGWDIPHCDGQEADIYDFNDCFYMNWLDDTKTLIGSVRLIPFSHDNLMTTVFKSSVEKNKFLELQQNKRVWEGTRLCLNEDALDDQLRPGAIVKLLMGLFKTCRSAGIEVLLCNCNILIYRLYKSFGLNIEHIGDTNEFRHGKVYCLAFEISDENLMALKALAKSMDVARPEVVGKGFRFARAFNEVPTTEARVRPNKILAPLFLPTSESALQQTVA